MTVTLRVPLFFAACAALSLICAQTKPKDNPNDWPMYTRDLGGTRYSPLKRGGGNPEATPIVVNGMMYLPAGKSVLAPDTEAIGATNDNRFRAFDSKTGKELWAIKLPRNVNANPITYAGKSGKQYVAVIGSDSVTAFSLP